MLLDLRNENRQKYIFASQDFPVRFTYKEPFEKVPTYGSAKKDP